MNVLPTKDATAVPRNIRDLNGQIVLVRSARDQHNPPTGMRGWIEVHDTPAGETAVNLAVEFPQMFTTPAHHRTIPLDDAALVRLLASENNGVFEFTLNDEL
jgi:hypothetical protein